MDTVFNSRKVKVKQRLYYLDFVRAFCAIGIVWFHFWGELWIRTSYSIPDYLYRTPNDSYGGLFVTIFFFISGGVLYYNHNSINSLRDLKNFYCKRWMSVFPAFYIAFLYYYIHSMFLSQKFFYGPDPKTLLLSVIGMDGFFKYKIENYYQVGEWFMGAILILYLLYPLVLIIMNSCRFIMPVILALGWISMYSLDIYSISDTQNLITCLTSFYIGIIIMKNEKMLKNRLPACIMLICFVLLYFYRIDIKYVNLVYIFQAFSLYIPLLVVGDIIMKNTGAMKYINHISRISFCIFLLQHTIIYSVIGLIISHNYSNTGILLLIFFIDLVYTLICADFLYVITGRVVDRIHRVFGKRDGSSDDTFTG